MDEYFSKAPDGDAHNGCGAPERAAVAFGGFGAERIEQEPSAI